MQSIFLRATLLLAALLPFNADSRSWWEPGDDVNLKQDEGLGLIFIDSDSQISELALDRVGGVFDAHIGRLDRGRFMRLLPLAAGTYRLRHIKLRGAEWEWTWEFPQDVKGTEFTVEPGKINYFGDVITRGFSERTLRVDNRSSNALLEMETHFPELLQRHAWRYGGHFPDPFIPLVVDPKGRRERARGPETVPLPEHSDREAALAAELFSPDGVHSLSLAPSGLYFVEIRSAGATHQTAVIRTSDLKEYVIHEGEQPSVDIEWIDDHRLVMTLTRSDGSLRSQLLTFPDGDAPPFTQRFGVLGFVLTPTQAPGEVLFVSTEKPTNPTLYRTTVDQLVTGHPLRGAKRVQREVKSVRWWNDPSGELRLAAFWEGKQLRYRYFSADGETSDFALSEDPNVHEAIAGFSSDGRLLLVSDRDRPQRDLLVFDPVQGRITGVAYSQPGRDVQALLRGARRVVTGVVTLNHGRFSSHPLQAPEVNTYQSIISALPGRSVVVFDAGKNGYRVVLAGSSTDPGTYYLYDQERRALEPISRTLPSLAESPLAETKRMIATAKDGFAIESFLTRPLEQGATPAPLVVIIHGGPIGAFDMDSFDPEVQYLAKLGYAVLQVNYRGSGNKGSADHSLGFGEFGKGIESDIDVAVDAAIAEGGIDRERVVAFGSSYGGYSALMLASAKPQRYKAAVSVAGVTDLPLLFSAGDTAHNEGRQALYTDWVGDPFKSASALQAVSPAYLAAKLTRPVLLVHTRNDHRVTFEHARRLQLAMREHGAAATFIALDDEAHGLVAPETQRAVFPTIAAFIRSSLATATHRSATSGAPPQKSGNHGSALE